jgi:hypothetical protein
MADERFPAGAGLPSVRASDAEREETVRRLSHAMGVGRLTLEELTNRVDTAYRAATRAELEPLVADLPVPAAEASLPAAGPARPRKARRRWVVSVMGEHDRLGRWRMGSRTTVVTLMGETKLDLRGAVIEDPEVRINAWLMMGEQRIVVPQGVEVEVTGFLLMGSRRISVEDAPARTGMPRVRIRTLGMMGEVRVETA